MSHRINEIGGGSTLKAQVGERNNAVAITAGDGLTNALVADLDLRPLGPNAGLYMTIGPRPDIIASIG